MSNCLNCNKKVKRLFYKYCSNKCQFAYQYKEYIKKWKAGLVNDNRGIISKNISGHIRRYLIERCGGKCFLCGWSKINSVTKRVPLEIDRINGNADDNDEKNLRLICPNCHSLSPTFRNLNRGKGRAWRMTKYLKAGFA